MSSNHEVPQVEVTTPVAAETTPIEVKIYMEEKGEIEAVNDRIEKSKEKEKVATKIEEKIVEEKKDEDVIICNYGLRGN